MTNPTANSSLASSSNSSTFTDPFETHNLATDRPKKTAHLTNALTAWLKRTQAKLTHARTPTLMRSTRR